eukprot:3558540-Lingulodinium_polyedra.AAC.1
MMVETATDRLRTNLLQLEEDASRDSSEREALALKKAALDAEAGQMVAQFGREEQRLNQVWESVQRSEMRNADEAATLHSLYQE